ncbi:MAG: hypothetical protein DMF56_11865 [Acidobacteria bacterium]|nr:MAG: hypothetical protein DMF56_11865 [Acidobacteriota bacterium]
MNKGSNTMKLVRVLLLSVCTLCITLSVSATFCVPPSQPAAPPPPDTNPPVCDPECHNCSASPCYPAFGTYVDQVTDLQISTVGFPLTVSRRYDSARPSDGPLGAGWSSSLTAHLYYAVYLQSAPNTYSYEANVLMPNGTVSRFTNSGGGTFSPPFGRRDSLVHNGNSTWSLAIQNSRTVYLFGADGSLQSVTDDYGNAITFTYDANGRVQRLADAAGSGRYVDVTWGPNGRIASVTDHTGRTVKYFYESAAATLTSVSDPIVSSDSSQRSTYYSYIAGRFGPAISRIEDRWHRVISDIAWYTNGKLKSYTEGEYNDANPSSSTGEKYTYTYSAGSVNKTHSLGTRTFTFNAGGQITNHVTYNASGQPAVTTDDLGFSTGYTYNLRGNIATKAQGDVTFTYTYDSAFPDQVASIKSNQPATWQGSRYTYFTGSPAPGALKQVYRIRKDGTTADEVASHTYNSHGQVAISTIFGVDTQYFYNAAGDLTSVYTSPGAVAYAYDSLGRMTSSTNTTGQSTSYSYDALGRIASVTLPKPSAFSTLNFTTTYSYDNYVLSDGLIYTVVTDPNGRVAKQGYDALGRLIKSVDAAGNATLKSYQYNLLHSITDANANATIYAYNANRNLASTTFPDGNVERYVGGESGTLTQVTDRRGTVRNYTYDAFGHMTKLEYPATSVTVNYSWLGNLPAGANEVVNSILKYTDVIEYDERFRLQKEERLGGYQITYSYVLGQPQIASYTVTPPSGSSEPPITVSYGYGAGGVDSITASTIPGSFSYTYTLNGQYDAITFPNGQQRKYEYDLQGRVTRVSNTVPGSGNVADYEYGYDYNWTTSTYTMLGQRTSVITNAAPNTGGQPNGQTKYYYDAMYQLTKALYPDGASDEWTYDAIVNRTGTKMFGALVNFTYDQNAAGKNTTRLRSYTGSNTLTYDANGNMLVGSSGSFTWDHANRLSSFGPQVFEYDAQGRRTRAGASGAPLSLINQGS